MDVGSGVIMVWVRGSGVVGVWSAGVFVPSIGLGGGSTCCGFGEPEGSSLGPKCGAWSVVGAGGLN